MDIVVRFDDRALQDAFRQYIAHSKRSPAVIAEKQMTQLAIGAKGVKGLYQEALALRPQVIREIRALPARLGYRIKRQGGSVKAEIFRRTLQAGRFQATGWLAAGIPTPRGKGVMVKTVRGELSISGGPHARIRLTNTSPNALEFGNRTGYIQRALDARARDMLVYVKKQLASDAVEFSKPRPMRFSLLSDLVRV